MSTNNYQKRQKARSIVLAMIIITLIALFITSIALVIALIAETANENKSSTTDRNYDNTHHTTSFEDNSTLSYEDQKYTVQSGDNYWSISVKFYDTGLYYKALARYNGMETTDVLHIGKVLNIPNLEDPNFIKFMDNILNENAENIEKWNNKMAGQTIKAGPSTSYKYGQRQNPAVDITVPELDSVMKNNTAKVNTSGYTYLGSYKITGYTPSCEHCCENTDGTGAAGVSMICGYSVAAPEGIPFGTTLYIEGYGYYVVEDRGYLGDSTIDIACPTHNACYAITNNNINVYIVSNP